MRLTRRQGWLLVGAAAWTWYVWLTRIWNIVADETRSTGFKAVHIALAVVSVALLTPVGWIGIRSLRSGGDGSGASNFSERVDTRLP
jgi:hypothetical protein